LIFGVRLPELNLIPLIRAKLPQKKLLLKFFELLSLTCNILNPVVPAALGGNPVSYRLSVDRKSHWIPA